MLDGIRSEHQLIEQLNDNLLFRCFVGLRPDDAAWDATTFTKSRDRLQRRDVFQKFMAKLLGHPQVAPLVASDADAGDVEVFVQHSGAPETLDGRTLVPRNQEEQQTSQAFEEAAGSTVASDAFGLSQTRAVAPTRQ